MQNYHGRPVYFHSVYNPVNINADYGLLTKCEIKMAGYWPSSFSVCLWTKAELRKNQANIQHLDRTSLVNKGFIIWLSENFFLWDTAGSPKWARLLHLTRLGSQSQCRIQFILPAHGSCHIISNSIIQLCLARTGNYQIHKLHWLKLILKAVQIVVFRLASRLVTFCSEKVAN